MNIKLKSLLLSALFVVSMLLSACDSNGNGVGDPADLLRKAECSLVQPGTFMGGACGK